jgi:hypothetical protein
VTIIYQEDIDCTFKENIDLNKITGHFLVYADNIFDDALFHHCMNPFSDAFSNGGFFARMAQQVGAAGILTQRFSQEATVCVAFFYKFSLL